MIGTIKIKSTNNVLSYTSGSAGGGVVLDFSHSSVRKRSGSVFSYTSGSSEGEVILDFKGSTVRKQPRYWQDHTYEWLFRQSGSVATQADTITSQPSGDIVTITSQPSGDIVGDFRNATITSDSARSGSSSLPIVNDTGLLADTNTSESTGDVVGCFLPQNSNFANTNGQNVPKFIGTQCRQAGIDEGSRISRTVKQRRLARVVSASTRGSTNAQVCLHDTKIEEIATASASIVAQNFGTANGLKDTQEIVKHGEVYHWIGSLCPNEGDPPRFLQLYIYDTENEVSNRMRHFGGEGSGGLDQNIVPSLIGFLDEHNKLVRVFRTARDKCAGQFVPDFKIRLYSVAGSRQYDLPTCQTLGGIVFQSSQDTETDYDVIIQSKGGPPQRINKLHPSYMSLQFPLLFIFGQPVLYTIEFQKRGLPHCHTLLWVDDKDQIQRAENIDQYISAELPDPEDDPQGYRVVSEMMVHGPCGLADPSAACTKESRCSKNFPKRSNDATYFDKDGYAHYRIRETNIYTTRRGADLDNTHVVPYNRDLCLIFDAHINVEYCGWNMLIKYLFKYISKGTDRIVAQITRPIGEPPPPSHREQIQVDEIQNFVDGRYICPYEAFWRIFKFEIHCRHPDVQILCVHLQNMQVTTFRDRQPLEVIASDDGKKKTPLTEWLEYNKFYTDGRGFTYLDFPKHCVWYPNSKTWRPRQRQGQGSIGRLAHVHPSAGELFYFRMLLCHQKGCQSFEDIRTVNNRLYSTFRSACEAFRLLGDDKEWDTALMEACFSSTPSELRILFVQLLIFCEVSDPLKLWRKYWRRMSDDIPRTTSKSLRISQLHINDPVLEEYALFELEFILKTFSKSLEYFGLPPLSRDLLDELRNRELMEEKSYNHEELAQEVIHLVPRLNTDQKAICDRVLNTTTAKQQELIFVYGHGGTGKTFLWKTIINTLRSQGKIVLAVASSGIASLLLPSGRTAHSRLKFPLELTDESVCKITKNTHAGRSFLVVTSGTLSRSKKGATKPQTIASSIAESYLWNFFKVFTLTENIRLLQPGTSESEKESARIFASWLLDIGDGNIGEPDVEDSQSSFWVQIPDKYCIPDDDNRLSNLISFIYDKDTLQHPSARELQQKAIVCTRNDTADMINSQILKMVDSNSTIYKSSDEAIPLGNNR
nr:DNA helicase [Tanacetum cinerariifolium]